MAFQKHYGRIYKPSKFQWIINLWKDFWFKRIENNNHHFTYGSSYSSYYEFRWQRLWNLINFTTIIIIIICIVL